MKKIITSILFATLLLLVGCNHSNIESIPDTEKSTVSTEETTDLSNEQQWIEGVIESIQETDDTYVFTIVPWSQDSSATYTKLTVEATKDLEVKWSTSGDVLPFDELKIDEFLRLVRVNVELNDAATDEYPSGTITQMFLLIG